MDTGGKIATGILVPLAVGGAAVAAYFLLVPKKMQVEWATSSDGTYNRMASNSNRGFFNTWDGRSMVGGKRRRCTRRRR